MARETRLSVPQVEYFYYDEDSKTHKPLASGGAIPVKIIGGGAGGGSSMNFYNGEANPENDFGQDGDLFINSNTGDLFKKEEDAWKQVANLKGAKGDKGDKGETGAKGDAGAQGQAGAKGDKGEAGAPGAKGDKGDKGDKGEAGAPGAPGAKGDKGDKGADGFGTEAQYNDIISRLEALEKGEETP